MINIRESILKCNLKPRVESNLPGRLRLLFPRYALLPDSARPYLHYVEDVLMLLPGVHTVRVNARIGYMPQRDQLFAWRSIWANVTLGLELRGRRDPAQTEAVRGLLSRYGLSEFAHCVPAQLSGGMRQRCALIRTLATGPRILLLDEPFSALDYQTRLSVAGDIHSIIKNEGKTALLVTHDIAEAVSMSDRVIVLSARPGRLKRVIDQRELRGMTPMQRRDDPAFTHYFNLIWKEIDPCG